jgi:hypothetical protein
VEYRVGSSKTKVQAINDGVADIKWSLMILASDDMIPQRADYAQYIKSLFREKFPKGDGVLHMNDGHAGRNLNTLPIMDRKYFDRFGYVYHPAYDSVFADNEFQEVSESLGRAAYIDEIVIAHEWIGNTHPKCPVHRRNDSLYSVDEITFRHRRAAGFPH